MNAQDSKCFWNGYNAAWPWQGGPSGGRYMPIAAT